MDCCTKPSQPRYWGTRGLRFLPWQLLPVGMPCAYLQIPDDLLALNVASGVWYGVSNDIGLQALDKLNYSLVDLLGSLLLGPMTATWKQKCSPELRYKLRQVGDDLVHPTKG